MKDFHRYLGLLMFLVIGSFTFADDSHTTKATVGTWPIGKADGVAIWIHPTDTSRSIIVGADPSKGLGTFNLKGKLIEVVNFAGGGAAGVDVRYNFPLGNEKITIVASGNNKKMTLHFFKIDPETLLLEEITGRPTEMKIKPYGLCLYHSKKTGKYYVFVASRKGFIEQWELKDNGQAKVDATLVREINIMQDPKVGTKPKTEACVADDELGWIYISQEVECNIWRYGAEPESGSARTLVDNAKIAEEDNVEGLAIYHVGEKDGYLLASIQGSWKYKVYTREGENKLIGTFNVTTADGHGLIESHDCIEVTNVNLGPEFPSGLMVTQNANNECGDHFQLVPWQSIAELFQLNIDLTYDPRAKSASVDSAKAIGPPIK